MAYNEKHAKLRAFISGTIIESMKHMGKNVEPEDRVDVRIVSDLIKVMHYVDPEYAESLSDQILLLAARDQLEAERGKDGA